MGEELLDPEFIYIITRDPLISARPSARSPSPQMDPLIPMPIVSNMGRGKAVGALVRYTGERGQRVPHRYKVRFIIRIATRLDSLMGNLATVGLRLAMSLNCTGLLRRCCNERRVGCDNT